MTTIKITIPADRYADHDDCLSAAAEDARSEFGLDGYDLSPAWADEQRDEIELSLPASVLSIQMTAEQTEIYDDGDAPAQDELMRDLRARAQRVANATRQPVEIYLAGGVVADHVPPRT